MLESGTSGSVGGEGGNLLVYPAATGYRQPEDIPPGVIGEKYAISGQILSRFCPIDPSKQTAMRGLERWKRSHSRVKKIEGIEQGFDASIRTPEGDQQSGRKRETQVAFAPRGYAGHLIADDVDRSPRQQTR
jgi:hypothetical protein